MAAVDDSVKIEARRLLDMPTLQARAHLNDRIARAFLEVGDDLKRALDFNARLATEIRVQAATAKRQTFWA